MAAALGATATLGLAYLLFEAQWLRRVDLRLPAADVSPELDGLVVAVLSDFHAGFRPSLNLRAARRAVDLVCAARPDLVLIPGDFGCGEDCPPAFFGHLERLAAPLGVFAVLGNHDHGDSKVPFVRPTDPAELERHGVRVLRNEAVRVARGGAGVVVAGLDDSDGGHDDLAALRSSLVAQPGDLRLLVSHHAEVVHDLRPGEFHLTVAGDTHGGQICLPLPGRRVLLSDPWCEFAEGPYDVGGRRLYVTRGVGTSLLPFRAFCRPEVVVIRVEAAR